MVNDYYLGLENSMTTQSYRMSMISSAMNAQISGNNRSLNLIETLSNRYQYSKVVSKIGNYGTYVLGFYNTYQGYKLDGKEIGYHTQRALSGSLFGGLGGYFGANCGAYVGAGIGAYFGGVGAVPGAIIGGFIGSYFGGSCGQTLGENVVDEYYK